MYSCKKARELHNDTHLLDTPTPLQITCVRNGDEEKNCVARRQSTMDTSEGQHHQETMSRLTAACREILICLGMYACP